MRHSWKRALDLVLALPAAILTAPLALVLIVVATIDTRASGLFRQVRIGREGQPFTVAKIRTMREVSGVDTTVTAEHDPRITRLGSLMRRTKLDEIPQLWNVVAGRMSLIGPRPDVAGYADRLAGEHDEILSLRPGISGPATLVFRAEESLLGASHDPPDYNDTVVWPAKVEINAAYAAHATLLDDLRIITLTLHHDRDRLCRLLTRWDPALVEIAVVRLALDSQ